MASSGRNSRSVIAAARRTCQLLSLSSGTSTVTVSGCFCSFRASAAWAAAGPSRPAATSRRSAPTSSDFCAGEGVEHEQPLAALALARDAEQDLARPLRLLRGQGVDRGELDGAVRLLVRAPSGSPRRPRAGRGPERYMNASCRAFQSADFTPARNVSRVVLPAVRARGRGRGDEAPRAGRRGRNEGAVRHGSARVAPSSSGDTTARTLPGPARGGHPGAHDR